MAFPLLVKANIGGSGAGIVRYRRRERAARIVADGSCRRSVDQVLLVQDYVPARGGTIIRIETLGGHFLYAIEIESGGDSFDLCPADACVAAARTRGDPDDGGRPAADIDRRGRADRARRRPRRRRYRSGDRRPRRRAALLRHQRHVQFRRESAGRARLGPARTAGRLPRSAIAEAKRHEVRLLDARLRRLAAQHPRRGDGGELGLCETAHPAQRGDRLGPYA